MRRSNRRLRVGALVVAFSVSVAAVAEAEPAYLAEMPTVEAVRSAVRGETPLDTLAYQAAVFDALRQILQTRTERPGALADPASLSAGERAVLERYQQASREIFATPGVEKGDLLSAGLRYSATPNFEDQVAGRFFSPGWLADYAAARTRFQTAYENQADRDGADTSTSTEDWGPTGGDDSKPGILDRVLHGPDGETITARQLISGSAKGLGALAIVALLAVRFLRRKPDAEE